MQDLTYMKRALKLAQKGCGYTSPNPMVGAVIVKDRRIIGEGYHQRCGDLHAERKALASCTESPAGATIYVTLEPCCHYGKQPPCTDAIIESGISRVVVGSGDPNPAVAGKGIQILRQHGIEVTEHVLEDECRQLNEVFFHYIQTKRPFVVMKYAMTMDGKIAAYTGKSKWVTGKQARQHVHWQRHKYTAIMVGVNTVLMDDPLLTRRIENGRNPIRIICDSHLRTPLTSQIVQTASETPTILATLRADDGHKKKYENKGCHVLTVSRQKDGHINLSELMDILGNKYEIDSIFLEGGAALNWSALESGIVQKVQAYIAPKLFGGATAKNPVSGQGFSSPSEAVLLSNSKITQLGEDFLIESEVISHVHRDR